MNARTFTPGPWRVDPLGVVTDSGPSHYTICKVFAGWVGTRQADGNAALIAAAPELHTAAAEVFAWIDCGFLTVGVLADDDPARVAACGRAIDALAAALGKASERGAS